MSGRKRPIFAAITFFCFTMVVLGAREYSTRLQEAAMGLNFVPDELALKYEFLPGGALNSGGFNERELPKEKPAGIKRVAVLGDSVTHGASVVQPQIYSRVAEDLAHAAGRTDIQTLNFAVHGYDIESIRGLAHARIGAFHPDLVVYGFYINDPIRTELVDTKRGRPDRHPVWVGTGPRDFSVLSPTLDPVLHRYSAFFRAVEGARGVRAVAARATPEKLQWDWFELELDRLIQEVQALGVPLVVLMIPPHVMIKPDLDACDELAGRPHYCAKNQEVLTKAGELFAARGLRTIDGVAAYREGGFADLFALPDDLDHPNAEGQRRLGVALGTALPGLLP
jgi:GDSL-like Lipase/Acylhydrolase family